MGNDKKESRVFLNQTGTRRASVKFAEAYKRAKIDDKKSFMKAIGQR